MIFKKKSHSLADNAKNWYKDKYEYVRQQRDVLAAITLISLLFSAGAVFTVMWLTPYKSVEPFVIQIDEKTGIVQRVDPVTRTEFTSNESVDRFFIAQYIRSRETYIRSVFRYNYDVVRVMSDRFVFNLYNQYISEKNPESPAFILKGDGIRTVKFKNIAFIKREGDGEDIRAEKVAQARILLTDYSRKFPAPIDYHSVVTLTFQYMNLNLNEEERYWNPLGFLVTNYAIEREVIQ